MTIKTWKKHGKLSTFFPRNFRSAISIYLEKSKRSAHATLDPSAVAVRLHPHSTIEGGDETVSRIAWAEQNEMRRKNVDI